MSIAPAITIMPTASWVSSARRRRARRRCGRRASRRRRSPSRLFVGSMTRPSVMRVSMAAARQRRRDPREDVGDRRDVARMQAARATIFRSPWSEGPRRGRVPGMPTSMSTRWSGGAVDSSHQRHAALPLRHRRAVGSRSRERNRPRRSPPAGPCRSARDHARHAAAEARGHGNPVSQPHASRTPGACLTGRQWQAGRSVCWR